MKFLLPLLFCLPANAALLLHLSFDDSFVANGYVADQSGNGNHAWRMNATNWITASNNFQAFGAGSGYWETNFTQTAGENTYPAGQYCAVTNSASSLFGNLTNGSIAFWVRFNHKVGQLTGYLFDGNNTAVTNGWRVGRLRVGHTVEMRVFTSATVDSDGDAVAIASAYSINGTTDTGTADWRHYAFTWDCTANTSAVYTNGVLNAAGTCAGAPYLKIGTGPTWLAVGVSRHNNGTPEWGDDAFPNDQYMNGWLDEIRFYDETLSASQVFGLYSANTLPLLFRVGQMNVGSWRSAP